MDRSHQEVSKRLFFFFFTRYKGTRGRTNIDLVFSRPTLAISALDDPIVSGG